MKQDQYLSHCISGLFGSVLFSLATLVYANPGGPQIVHGQVTMSHPDPATLNIRNSPNAIINWKSFSIGKGETTRFIQQNASSAILNRVRGENPSALLGRMSSNGRVFLINPNGMVFGPNAVIDTAGFIGSTLNIKDDDFLAGRLNFEGAPGAGSIKNQGLIQARDDGGVYLIAPSIENSGIISTESGNLVLAAGRKITISSLDLEHISVEIQAPEDEVVNIGKLLTSGGAMGVFAGTIRNHGHIEADTLTRDAQGNIRLVAQADIELESGSTISASGPRGGRIQLESKTGTTRVSGAVEARGRVENGGEVQLLGKHVALNDAATIDVSAERGGGTVLVGGDYKGQGEVRNATTTYVGPEATIEASAQTEGDGGKVIVWADDSTRYYGDITVRGGTHGGDGGFVEVSGKKNLGFDGSVDAGASQGNAGTLLLDPSTLTIIDTVEGDGDLDEILFSNSQILEGDPDVGDNTVSWSAIDALADDAIVVLEATNDVTIDNITGIFSGTDNFVQVGLTTGSLQISSTSGSINFADSNDTIATEGGDITLSAADNIFAGTIVTVYELGSGNDSGDITLTAGNNLAARSMDASSTFFGDNAGKVTLTATNGNISFNDIDASFFGEVSQVGNGGQIALTAGGDISGTSLPSSDTPSLVISSGRGESDGGTITLDAGGNISVFQVTSFGSNNGADIQLTANGDIVTSNLVSAGGLTGGNINLTSTNGSIDTSSIVLVNDASVGGTINASALDGIGGGSILFSAPGSITPADQVITTDNSITFNGPVALQANNTLVADTVLVRTSIADVSFNGAVNGTRGLVINSGAEPIISSISFGSTVGDTAPLTDLTATADTGIVLNGSVTTTGSQLYNGSVTLNADVVLTGQELDFVEDVTGTGSLGLQPLQPTQAILVGGTDTGAPNILDLTGAEINLLDSTISSITIGRADGAGALTVDQSGASFGSPLLLQSPGASGRIEAAGSVLTDGSDLEMIAGDSIALQGDIETQGGDINLFSTGNINGLNLNASSDSSTGGDMSINGNQIGLSGTVQTKSADITLTASEMNLTGFVESSGPEGNISVNGPVQTSGNDLKMTAGDNIAITEDIISSGGNIDLSSTNIGLVTATLDSTNPDSGSGAINVAPTAGGSINIDNSTLITDSLTLGGPVAGTSSLTLLPATTGMDIDIGSTTPGSLLSIDNIGNLSEFSGHLSVGGTIAPPASSTQVKAGDMTVVSDFSMKGDLTLVSLGDITLNADGSLQSGGTLTLAALGDFIPGSPGNISDTSISEARLFFDAPEVVFFANNEAGTLENPLTVKSGANTVNAGAGTGVAYFDGAPGNIIGSGPVIQSLFNSFQAIDINLDNDILNTRVVDLSVPPSPAPPPPEPSPTELVPPTSYPQPYLFPLREPDIAKSATSRWNSEINQVAMLDQWLELGPIIQNVFDASRFNMDVLVDQNSTIVMSYWSDNNSKNIGTTLSGKNIPTQQLQAQVTTASDGSIVAAIDMPDNLGAASGEVAMVNISIDVTDSSGNPAPIRISRIGLLPNTNTPGHTEADLREFGYEITNISFGPPEIIRPSDGQDTNYSFYSRAEFKRASVDFWRINPSSQHISENVDQQLIPERIRKGVWIGKDGSRHWSGLNWKEQPSIGQHELQIKAWNREGILWYIGRSDSRVTVSNED